ncbi:tripartite tricarboxylate transporter TctB family protein [Nocardioides sp. J2M5]|uniref:tripartite tricarboxylate transporter TctB family protein n=1 Tax=Nocardioides palaemonis TaxID=2829810 RepID=UPI001BA64E1E|nr:tripartite tricarboxylate transporter TctB family protein [Nocardioides palaemonis]MBS2936272.1 tripartite tricarboxylate transporter TctB family protein [Nocardioides palaemonis]
MSDERTASGSGGPDILEEIEAEVAETLSEEELPPGGPAYQTVGALVALAVGVGGLVLSLDYGLGSLRRPGPGLWPFVISVVITVLAVVLLLTGRRLEDSVSFSRASVLPAVGLLTFVGLGVLMPLVGFEIPSLVLCVVWLRFLGGETWRSTITISVGTVATFYALFLYGLSIPLPHLLNF